MLSSLEDQVSVYLHENEYTTDNASQLLRHSHIPVFVYGTEKKTFSDESYMNGCRRVGIGNTELDNFVLMKTKDAEPVLLNSISPSAFRVQGEVYLVPSWRMPILDARVCNGAYFNRRLISVIYFDPAKKDDHQKQLYASMAFAYIGNPTYWKQDKKAAEFLVDCRVFRPRPDGSRPYYSFTPMDDGPNKLRKSREPVQ